MGTKVTAATILTKARAKHNLSQREFASALGLGSHQIIDKWEQGSEPDTDTLIRLWLKSPKQWARDLAYRCLDVRYPGVFVNPVPLSEAR